MPLRTYTIRASFNVPGGDALEGRFGATGFEGATISIEQSKATLVLRRQASSFSHALERVRDAVRGNGLAVEADARGLEGLLALVTTSDDRVPFRERVQVSAPTALV